MPTACNFLLQERSRIFMIPFVPNMSAQPLRTLAPFKILKIQQQQQIQVWVF